MKYEFSFSNTLRSKNVSLTDIKGDVIIDVSGNIIGSGINVVIIGGRDDFAWRKDKAEYNDGYMNLSQINALSNFVLEIVKRNPFDVELHSDNEYLNKLVNNYKESARG